MNLNNTTRNIQRLVGAVADGIYGPETAAKILVMLNRLLEGKEQAEPNPDTGKGFDKRTEDNLASLQPLAAEELRPFVRHAIGIAAAMGVEAKVICGFRNKKEQEKAKASGASKAGWGFSWHNYGMAIDFGLFRGREYLDNSEPSLARAVYAAIGEVAPEYGVEWGGSWNSFKDIPHFHLDVGVPTPTPEMRRQLQEEAWEYR